MEYSEEYDYESDTVLLDDEEADFVHRGETDVSDTNVGGIPGLSFASPSSGVYEIDSEAEVTAVQHRHENNDNWYIPGMFMQSLNQELRDSKFQASQAYNDLSWDTPETPELQDFDIESSFSSPLYNTSINSPLVMVEEDYTPTSEPLSRYQESSTVTVPSTTSLPFGSCRSLLISTSTVPYAVTSSSESQVYPALPVEGNEINRTDSPGKEISKGVSPRGKKRKKDSENAQTLNSEDSSGQICPICMDEWSNSGAHRLCCLKCGHIYGESCIRRWLIATAASSGRCPQCNAKAKIRDIRPLFARSLRAIDTAENYRLALQLEESRRERERLELEVTRFAMANQMQRAPVEKL